MPDGQRGQVTVWEWGVYVLSGEEIKSSVIR